MKISKLFHWLYALLMLLPAFALLSAVLISTFNMSGKQETEITYKYETNEVNSPSDLKPYNIYKLDIINMPISESAIYTSAIYVFNTDNVLYNSFTDTTYDYFAIYKRNNNNIEFGSDYMYTGDSTEIINTYTTNYTVYVVNDSDNEFLSYCNDTDTNLFSISDYLPIESVETHNLNVEDVFYNAVDKVEQSPLFSWAYDSFLARPLVYIVTLFSMPVSHVVVELLSYWLAISIIWLVFDLIMYVPLLVHRWLDKGILE